MSLDVKWLKPLTDMTLDVQVVLHSGRCGQYWEENKIWVGLKDVEHLNIYSEVEKESSEKRKWCRQRCGKTNHDFRHVNVAMLSTMSKKRRQETEDEETSKYSSIVM